MQHLSGLVIILLIFKCLRKVVGTISLSFHTRAVNAACSDTCAAAGKVKVCQQTG